MKDLVKNIIRLHKQGNTHEKIAKILNCSLCTVSYHTNPKSRLNILKKSKIYGEKHPIKSKLNIFLRRQFKKVSDNPDKISLKNFYNKFGKHPKCYLTGKKINLQKFDTYQLDHVIPVCRGGKSNINNLGITITAANRAKDKLKVDEFLKLCENVLLNFNYIIKKPKERKKK